MALPPEQENVPATDGNALALLRAVGGLQAFMRAAASPPNAAPVSRFMLYEREFPDSVASSVQSLSVRSTGGARAAGLAPVLRVRRMLADLDFRARVSPGPEAVTTLLRPIQQELERSTRRSTSASSVPARSCPRR